MGRCRRWQITMLSAFVAFCVYLLAGASLSPQASPWPEDDARVQSGHEDTPTSFFQKGSACGPNDTLHRRLQAAAPLDAAQAAAEEHRYEQLYLFWRKKAGELSCKVMGIGPTGGFCRSKADPKAGGGSFLGEHLAHKLGNIFDNAAVIDMGCGLGQYGRYFKQHFSGVSWLGVDGSENIEEATDGFVKFLDLSAGLPTTYQHPWDWVMNIEVAEHVPREGEATFMHNLVKWAQKGVVLTWAKPGQTGHHHVNCQTNSYVHCAMRLLGMQGDECLKEHLVHASALDTNVPWLKGTVDIFLPITGPARHAEPTLLPLPKIAGDAFTKRYLEMTSKHCSPALVNVCDPATRPSLRGTSP